MTKIACSRGFTLLELLIGLTLVGFMLALLFGGLRLGMRSWDAGELRMDRSARMSLSAALIQSELGQIFPMRFHDPQDGEKFAFYGESGVLFFTGFLPPNAGQAGLHLIALETRSGENGRELVMRWARANPDDQDFAALGEAKNLVVLAKGVKTAEFAYFGAETIETEPTWHEQWQDKPWLPSLIRMRIELENDESWPEIVVPLLLEVEPT